MPERHLEEPIFTKYAVHLLKIRKRSKVLCKTGKTRNIYLNDLDKACFQQDMAYGSFNDLIKRTESDIKSLKLLVIQDIIDIKKVLL